MKLAPRRSILCLFLLVLLSRPCGRAFAQSHLSISGLPTLSSRIRDSKYAKLQHHRAERLLRGLLRLQ